MAARRWMLQRTAVPPSGQRAVWNYGKRAPGIKYSLISFGAGSRSRMAFLASTGSLTIRSSRALAGTQLDVDRVVGAQIEAHLAVPFGCGNRVVASAEIG